MERVCSEVRRQSVAMQGGFWVEGEAGVLQKRGSVAACSTMREY